MVCMAPGVVVLTSVVKVGVMASTALTDVQRERIAVNRQAALARLMVRKVRKASETSSAFVTSSPAPFSPNSTSSSSVHLVPIRAASDDVNVGREASVLTAFVENSSILDVSTSYSIRKCQSSVTSCPKSANFAPQNGKVLCSMAPAVEPSAICNPMQELSINQSSFCDGLRTSCEGGTFPAYGDARTTSNICLEAFHGCEGEFVYNNNNSNSYDFGLGRHEQRIGESSSASCIFQVEEKETGLSWCDNPAIKTIEERNQQDFDFLVVIDFEATCDNKKSLHPQEIIEFPSVLVDAHSLQIKDSWRVYVRPQVNVQLTSFCTKLTGIQQSQVDAGVPLKLALSLHDEWLRGKGVLEKRFAVVTWSDWDCKVMLETECKWKNIRKPPYFNQWINLKVAFGEAQLSKEKVGLMAAVEAAGLEWEGRAHSGLDDAGNTARLLIALISGGAVLKITGSFKIYGPDGSRLKQSTVKKRPRGSSEGSLGDEVVRKKGGGKCECGVKSRLRTVKKPGPAQGRAFYSCGKWTITEGGKCDFFVWAS